MVEDDKTGGWVNMRRREIKSADIFSIKSNEFDKNMVDIFASLDYKDNLCATSSSLLQIGRASCRERV